MVRYAITDGSLGRKLDQNAATHLLQHCVRLAESGVDFLLLREKHLAAGDLLLIGRALVDAVKGSAMRILIARRADVAIAAGAHGVHLSAAPGELTVEQVRRVMPGAIVSVSCHTPEAVRSAQGASLILFAPIFGKTVDGAEVVRGLGLGALRKACVAAKGMPVLALGGVTEINTPECLAAGGQGVAGIRMYFPQSVDLGRV